MKFITEYSNYFFLGIGGIGMSSLAQYFKKLGKNVAGYDRSASEITQKLQNQEIEVFFEDNLDLVQGIYKDKEETLIVLTPAIKELSLLEFYIKNNFRIIKRSEVLGLLTENMQCLAVAGSDGKSTTCAILTHILTQVNASVSAFLGAVAENFDSNLVVNGDSLVVVEADEFDRSFLRLSPNIACITNITPDHLDIYETVEGLYKGFKDFTNRLKPNGKLIVKNGLPFDGITFGIEDDSYYNIKNISVKERKYCFDLEYPELQQDNGTYEVVENFSSIGTMKKTIKNCTFALAGRHNLLNALSALSMAHQAGYPMEALANALESFKGVKRRFSYIINDEKRVFINDYAHLGSELKALYQAVKEFYPDESATIVFQPHLFTRTRDFADDFAQSLSLFDKIILLDIYPAREKPIKGITSKWLLDKISNPNKLLLSDKQLYDWIEKNKPKLLITAGAGDIGDKISHIKKLLE